MKRYHRSFGRSRSTGDPRQHRQLAAILADYAAEQRANEAFQKDIVVGTETNCGTVIQVRGPMVEIAVPPVRPTPNGQSTFWSKRTALTHPGPALCTYGL